MELVRPCGLRVLLCAVVVGMTVLTGCALFGEPSPAPRPASTVQNDGVGGALLPKSKVAVPDKYEPDETPSSAHRLGASPEFHSLPPGDVDYFTISLGGTATVLVISSDRAMGYEQRMLGGESAIESGVIGSVGSSNPYVSALDLAQFRTPGTPGPGEAEQVALLKLTNVTKSAVSYGIMLQPPKPGGPGEVKVPAAP